MRRNPTGYLGKKRFDIEDYYPIDDIYTAILNMWGKSSRSVSAAYLTCAVADLYGERTYVTRVGGNTLVKYEVEAPPARVLKLVFKEIADRWPAAFGGVAVPKQYKKFYDGFKEAVLMVLTYTQLHLTNKKFEVYRGLRKELKPELRGRTIESWTYDEKKALYYGDIIYKTEIYKENIIAHEDVDYRIFNKHLNITDVVSSEVLVFTGEFEKYTIERVEIQDEDEHEFEDKDFKDFDEPFDEEEENKKINNLKDAIAKIYQTEDFSLHYDDQLMLVVVKTSNDIIKQKYKNKEVNKNEFHVILPYVLKDMLEIQMGMLSYNISQIQSSFYNMAYGPEYIQAEEMIDEMNKQRKSIKNTIEEIIYAYDKTLH